MREILKRDRTCEWCIWVTVTFWQLLSFALDGDFHCVVLQLVMTACHFVCDMRIIELEFTNVRVMQTANKRSMVSLLVICHMSSSQWLQLSLTVVSWV